MVRYLLDGSCGNGTGTLVCARNPGAVETTGATTAFAAAMQENQWQPLYIK